MTDQESWADKINKLLRKAESTTPEEAELLFAKAQELMAKYAIDEAMLKTLNKSDAKADPIAHEEFVTVGIYRHALYMIDYYTLLVNGCQAIEIGGSPWREIDGRVFKETRILKAVGLKSDIEKARMLATSLKLQCMRAETAWWKTASGLYEVETKGKQHAARRGFMLAFARGAHDKMQVAFAKGREAAEQEYGSSSVALVLRDKSLMVQDEFEKLYPERKTSRSRMNAGDVYARGKGYEAGQKADIGQTGLGGKRKELA